jgi:hypothetical protein
MSDSSEKGAFGAIALAILAYALLLDTAVETFLSGSPVRWTVVVAVGAYLTLVVGVKLLGAPTRERFKRVTSAMGSGFILLALLSATAWMPEGLTRGMLVLGQSTSVVLSVASVLAIGVAGFGLIRGRKWSFQQNVAVVMSVVTAVSTFRVPAGTRTAASPGSSQAEPGAKAITKALDASYKELVGLLNGSTATPRPTAQELVDRLESMFPEVQSLADRLPRDSFDVRAVVEATGGDPIKLFQWVTDQTCFVPYRGVLRGEIGVLMDRRGNSLDRALLLYALIRSAGQHARLAHGALPADRAQELLSQTRRPSLCPMPGDTSPSTNEVGQIAEAASRVHKLDRAVVDHQLEAITREQQHVAEQVRKRVAEQTAAIAAAAGAPRDSARDSGLADADAVRDHWWVQWQSDTAWVDLDPTLHDAGKTLTDAAETVQPGKPSDLREDLQHVVNLRVVVEQWRQGQLREHEVLSHVLRPFELYGAHILLSHRPLGWPSDLDEKQGENRGALFKQTALAQKEWLPVLSVGRDKVMKSSFTDHGDVNANPMAPLLGSSAQNLGRGIGDLLGGGHADQTGERRPQVQSHLSALWIEYEVRSPGVPVRKIRRQLFDLIGPAARASKSVAALTMTEEQRFDRSLNLLGTTEILPLASQLSPGFVDHLTASSFLANRQVLLDVLRHGDALDSSDLARRVGTLTPLPGRLYDLALARNVWSRVRDQVYLDHPNILSLHSRPGLNARGRPVVTEGFDIAENGVAVNLSAPSAFAARLEQGVLDVNSEALLASGCSTNPSPGCAEVENVSEMFGSRSDVKWLVVREPGDPDWQHAELTADLRTRIEDDIAAGYVVVVPSTPVDRDGERAVGWWKIQPKTGQVSGIGRLGWGQATVENLIILGVGIAAVCELTKLVSQISEDWDRRLPNGQFPARGSEVQDLVVCGLAGAVTVWFVPAMTLTLSAIVFSILAGVLAGRTTRQ